MPDRPRPDRPHPDRARRAERDRRDRQPGWDQYNAFGSDTDTELPPWAGPAIYPARPGGTRLRPPPDEYQRGERPDPWAGDEAPEWPEEAPRPAEAPGPPPGRRIGGRRATAARLRKSRRRVLRWCGIAIVACVIAAGIAAIVTHQGSAKLPYVTSLQKGEFKSTPNACKVLPGATLSQYLPGPRSTVQSQDSPNVSECSFTVDHKPNFLVLTISTQSFEPFAAASGDGSASQNALDNYAAAKALLLQPPKHSPLPKATITTLKGVGQQSFLAIQLEHTGGIARDVATVAIRERNALVIVSMSGQESGGYGPVALGTLQGDAQAIANLALKQVQAQPTA